MSTHFERTPLALAMMAAVALITSPSFANTNTTAQAQQPADTTINVTLGDADDTAGKTIKKDVNSAVEWNKEWATKYGNKDAKQLTITGNNGSKTLTVTKDGALKNNLEIVELKNVDFKVNEGGSFINNGTLKLDSSSSLTITKPATFDNREAKIESAGRVTIEDSALINPQTEKAPNPIYMGDVKMTGASGVLTNNDKGYIVKTDQKDPKPVGRVVFGNVTLADGATFVQNDGAIDSGKTMTISGTGAKMTINGLSDWTTITLDPKAQTDMGQIGLNGKGKVTTNELVITKVFGNNRHLGDYIKNGTGDSALSIKDTLTLNTFNNGVKFTFSGEQMHGVNLASGASLNLGSIAEYKQNDQGKIVREAGFDQGTIIIEKFRANWTQKKANGTQPEAKPEWTATNHKFGTVTVGTNAKLDLRNNKYEDQDSRDKYKASVEIDRMNLVSSNVKLNYKIDTKTVIGDLKKVIEAQKLKAPEGIDNWTGADFNVNLMMWVSSLKPEEQKKLLDEFDKKMDVHTGKFNVGGITASNANHMISSSDLYIKELNFEAKQTEVTGDYSKFTTTTKADDNGKPENKDQIAVTETFDNLGSHTLNIAGGSRVEVGTLNLGTGTLSIEGQWTKFISHNVNKIDGTLVAKSGYVGLNVQHSMSDYISNDKKPLNPTNLILEVGAPITLGESAKVTFGGNHTNNTAAQHDGASLTFKGTTTLQFDASKLDKNALFVANGKQGKLTVESNAKVNIEAKNLSWGRYNLFENFNGKDSVAEGAFVAQDGKLSASDIWAEQLKNPGSELKVEVDKNGNVSILVGSDSVKGSGLDVNAQNLVSNIFKGDRTSAADLVFVNSLLHNGTSLADVSNAINTATGLGVISGVKAMSVDFAGYTADQIEHHASTMPHNMGGWWVQPIGSRMKTDDLAMGVASYGYSLDAYGLMGGYDIHRGDWTFGLAASYQSGDADSEGTVLPVSTKLKSKAAHLWGSKSYGETYVIGTFSYIQTDGETQATIQNQSLSADVKATALSAGIRAERNFDFGDMIFTPHVGARITSVDLDNYTIDLGKQKLFTVNEDKAMIYEVPVGVAIKTPSFMFQNFTVQPYADVTLRGRFGDTESSYTLKGSKTTDNIDYAVAGDFVGDLKFGYMSTYKNLNLGMSYSLSAGDAGRQNHALEATMRVDF